MDHISPTEYLQVDCAYYSDDLQEVNEDPRVELQQVLDSHGMTGFRAACPQCFDNLLKLVGFLWTYAPINQLPLTSNLYPHKGRNVRIKRLPFGGWLNTLQSYLGTCSMHEL